MRRNYKIVIARMDGNIIHRHGGQVQLEPRPARSLVERNIQPMFGAEEQQFGIAIVLTDHVDGAIVIGQTIANCLPCLAVVSGHIDVDIEVVAAMAIESCVCRAFDMARGHHASHVGPFGNALHFLKNIFHIKFKNILEFYNQQLKLIYFMEGN